MLCDINYMWNKKKKLDSQKQRVEKWLPGAGVVGEQGKIGKRVQSFNNAK